MNKQRHGLTVMATAVAVLVCGAMASANPIRFDNTPVGDPDHFVWYGGTGTDPIGLNVMTDLAGQDGSYFGVGEFHQATELPYGNGVGAPSGGAFQTGGDYDIFVVGVDYLTTIPSGAAFTSDFGITYDPDFGTWLPSDSPTYLGVKFPDAGGDLHYGWIGVVASWMPDAGGSGDLALGLDAFAWGYETEPGVPIQAGVPEPTTLALLALGAVGVLKRRW